MQIILAIIVGASLGVAVHFHLGHRSTRGIVVAPIIGALSAGLAWMLLTWAGVGIDSVWLWLSMLVVPLVVTYPAIILLSRVRIAHDARDRALLKIG